MNKKFYKNEKFQTWFFSILYFALSISIVITCCFIFKKVYYLPIVVSGHSMWPTLSGGGSETRYHYGYADKHRSAVNNLKRFDVVITYYPDSWPSVQEDYKIKRLWGFPGETLDMTYSEGSYTFKVTKPGEKPYILTSTTVEYVARFEAYNSTTGYYTKELTYTANEFVLPNKTFRTAHHVPIDKNDYGPRTFHIELKDNEYFVMGDNWQGSTDSYSCIDKAERLTKDLIQGRVICINAYVDYQSGSKQVSNEHKIEGMYDF